MPASTTGRRRRAPRVDRPQLVSIDAVAEFLDVDPRTVRRMIHDGKLPAYRIGRLVKIDMRGGLDGRRADTTRVGVAVSAHTGPPGKVHAPTDHRGAEDGAAASGSSAPTIRRPADDRPEARPGWSS